MDAGTGLGMNYSDERYVRIYIRDTPDWMIWPWESRALFPLLARKVDRAGVLDLGKHGARALAALVAMPVEVVAPGLDGLVEDGCVVISSTGVLVIRNFIEAQEAKASDKQRAAESRGRRRDLAAAGRVVTPEQETEQTVTKRDEPSQPVTERHGESHAVTPSRAVPSRAEKNLADAAAGASAKVLTLTVAPDGKPKRARKPKAPPSEESEPTAGADKAAFVEYVRTKFAAPLADFANAGEVIRFWRVRKELGMPALFAIVDVCAADPWTRANRPLGWVVSPDGIDKGTRSTQSRTPPRVSGTGLDNAFVPMEDT